MRNYKILMVTAVCIAGVSALFGCGSIKFDPNSTAKSNQSAMQQQHFKQKKVALVLGGGGAKGFAHVGVLEELHKHGVVPDVIIGCSAGAIVGALYATNPDIEVLKSQVLQGKSAEIVALSVSEWPYSMYSSKPMTNFLKKNLKVTDFAATQIPLLVTATDLQDGETKIFSDGDIVSAVIASAAYPMALSPIKIDDRYYIDCGISDPLPTRIAKEMGFETVIAVNISEGLPTSAPNHAFGVLKRSTEIGYINLIKNSLLYADVVIDFNFVNIDLFDDKQNQYLYEQGKIRASQKMPEIIKLTQLLPVS